MAEEENQVGNAQRIPAAAFIEDVSEYVTSKGGNSERVIQELNENYQKFKLVEQQLLQRRVRLQHKLPEIRKALDSVTLLIEKKASSQDLVVDFELADQVFTKARVKKPETVKLWLGANVMLEYSLDEARELLQKNLDNCKLNLETNQKDLNFVKDSITTTEVSIARVYNHDVAMRKSKEADGMDAP